MKLDTKKKIISKQVAMEIKINGEERLSPLPHMSPPGANTADIKKPIKNPIAM